MKKYTLYFILFSFSFVLFSCSNQDSTEETNDDIVVENITTSEEFESVVSIEEESIQKDSTTISSNDYIGHWVGWFQAEEYDMETDFTWSNYINISIEEIKGDSVFGRSIVAGNDRPFEGIMYLDDGFQSFNVVEPGDDKYDGVFTFYLRDTIMMGYWDSYDKDLQVTKREYELEKKTFAYNPENSLEEGWLEFIDLGRYKEIVEEYDGEVYYDQEIATVTEKVYEFNPSLELIPEDEIANMMKGDLQVLRNSIYARHGYSFKNRIYRAVFEQAYLPWYVPMTTDVRDELTSIELQNIEMMKRYEDYAEDYYDVFGR